MGDYISFPGLGIFDLDIPRVAFTVFGKNIYWYGIIISLGFVLALVYACVTAKRYHLVADNVLDMAIIAVPLAVVCARLYYVVFRPEEFHSFYDVIAIWNGGIAIYGAIIGGFIALMIYSKCAKKRLGDVLDAAAIPVMIGQCVGRWGNFVNREAFGGPTDLPWRMEILHKGEYISVHPTFLYESLWNFAGVIALSVYAKKRKFSGEITLLYFTWYALGRVWIEGMRTDSLYWGPFRVSQVLSAILIVVCITLLVLAYRKVKKNPEWAFGPAPAAETVTEKAAEAAKEESYTPVYVDLMEEDSAGDDAGKAEDAEDAENAEDSGTDGGNTDSSDDTDDDED